MKIVTILKQVWINAKYLLTAQSCVVCRQDAHEVVCFSCAKSMQVDRIEPLLLECEEQEVSVYCVSQYQGVFKKLLARLKFNHDVRLADVFAHLLDQWWEIRPDVLDDIDCIIAVPIHAKRYRYRGFNQSELILQRAYQIDHNVLDFTTVYRTRYTLPQSKSSKHQRAEQLKQVFAQHSPIQAKHILIFDDVFTTGSTVRYLIDALMANPDNHIGKISVLALAKVREG